MALRSIFETLYERIEENINSEFSYLNAIIWSVVSSTRDIMLGVIGGLLTVLVLSDLPAGLVGKYTVIFLILAWALGFTLRVAVQKERL